MKIFDPFEPGSGPPVLGDSSTFEVPSLGRRKRRALLINPPVYDSQYWARWSQPAGLLRIATHLKSKRYDVSLIDCMEADQQGFVPKRRLRTSTNDLGSVQRDDIRRELWHYGMSWETLASRMQGVRAPHEVWITSVMTYWWESTRDAVNLARRLFPKARIYVGGIYPTLATDHALKNLREADMVFRGELTAASDSWTDLSLYERPPSYSIVTTSRGCPWDCNYCAARSLNGGSNKVRGREAADVVEEMRHKRRTFGVNQFGFYEDNALVLRGHLQEILELTIAAPGFRPKLYAPEGFETRLLTEDLLRIMRKAGFKKIHLPFETLKWETTVGWNRRHASTASFEAAFEAAVKAGFVPRSTEINAFVLFGLPDDNLSDIMDGVTYVHNLVGSIIPMLFTPVPGTNVYREHRAYLHDEMGWDLQHLNGKFLPFLEYNRRRYPALRASDYLSLESLMSVLNQGKVLSRAVNLCAPDPISTAFRSAILART
jgi:radical SAM superfamily enzyme YgiQ (UPF0313 family)